MAWYYIVCIVIGTLALLILIAYLRKLFRERKADKDYERALKLEEAMLTKYHYPKLYAIRVSKEVLSRFTVNPAPPNSIPLGHDLYQTEDGKMVLCSTPVQVIYYESAYSDAVNDYINKHYEDIYDKLKAENITFVYIPKTLAYLQESIKYIHPDIHDIALGTYTSENFYEELKMGIVRNPSTEPLLIVPDFSSNAGYPDEELDDSVVGCNAFILNYINEEQFDFVFQRHLDIIIHKHLVRYRTAKALYDEDIADYESIDKIAKEIRDRISLLYSKGVSEYIISKIVSLPEPKLSTLLITEDFRIFLPDYNNMEITMPTLSKALYFFYLRHPEGVLFKELRNHKEELSEIYRTISLREDMDKIEKSINDIVDSTKNSVNEKCSRIKAAFVSQFNDKLAKNYYITGYAGEPKTISLDRHLIINHSSLV